MEAQVSTAKNDRKKRVEKDQPKKAEVKPTPKETKKDAKDKGGRGT